MNKEMIFVVVLLMSIVGTLQWAFLDLVKYLFEKIDRKFSEVE